MARPLRLQVFEGVDALDSGVAFYVRMVGGNGEILMSSEGYAKRGNALRAAKRIHGKIAAGSVVLDLGE